jgi:hypothetical protein
VLDGNVAGLAEPVGPAGCAVDAGGGLEGLVLAAHRGFAGAI